MSRLMSVALTEDAVRERRKTVTRRLGWWEDKRGRRVLKPGDRLTLCRKVMGRKAYRGLGAQWVPSRPVSPIFCVLCESGEHGAGHHDR